MLDIARLVLVTLICWGLAWFLCKAILAGLRTGEIAYTRYRWLCRRTANPLGFWLLVALFLCIALMMVYVWYVAVWRID